MTSLATFLPAVALLLFLPGPTNALAAAIGATAGLRRLPAAVATVLAGYALALGLLIAVIGPAVSGHPILVLALKAVAVVVLARSAWKLWHAGRSAAGAAPLSLGHLFTVTLLNPKTLVFAFALFPPAAEVSFLHVAGFAGLAVLAIGIWMTIGAALRRAGDAAATPERVGRVSALVLAGFASMLALSAVASPL